jgi:hypothetical protein
MSHVVPERPLAASEIIEQRPVVQTVAHAEQWSNERASHVAFVVALVLGAVIRGWHTLGADFPLNDGGLFYVMVRDIQRAHYHLPAFTSYNGGRIPFGYSPFTFYLAALLNDATGVSLVTLFRVLPWAASTACIGAVYLLARSMVTSRAAVTASAVAFAVIPRSFVWLIMGGGLTRSFGYLFALLALHRVWMLYTHRSLRYAPLAAVFSALTVSSHLGTAPFVAFSAALFFVYRGRHRAGVLGSALVGIGTLVLTAPWWATVVATHGIGPFIAARATGGSILSDMPTREGGGLDAIVQYALRITGEGRFPLMLILAIVGVVWCARERRLLILPAWWVTILALDARAGFTYAAAPVAMLAGLGAVNVIWPVLAPQARGDQWSALRRVGLVGASVLLLASIVASSSRSPRLNGDTNILTALTPADRAAMAWMALHTDSSARVLVLTDQPWQIDKVSEWFPVLAERVSVATVQGTEWLERGAFQAFIRRQAELAACANRDVACLGALRADSALQFTHVYAPTGDFTRCCAPLIDALRRDPGYQSLYSNEGAVIFARR